MKKILIVDDEPMMLKLADRALKKQYETILASSGAEAVELFEEESPDLVLSDLKMPSMSGYDLQKAVSELCEVKVPFIFMTADDSDDSESRGFEQGAADYIRKPLKSDLLLKRIERILDAEDENARLREAAQTDAMTGLTNKAATEAILTERCWKTPGMLLLVDLDNFKLVNDRYGHTMGDKILVAFADLLRSSFRGSDTVGRIGGDEFLVFCEGLGMPAVAERKAAEMNEKISAVAKEMMGDQMDFSIGCSVGGCVSGPSGELFATLFKRADAAMYEVKQRGKHGCVIDTGLMKEGAVNGGFAQVRSSYPGRGEDRWSEEEEQKRKKEQADAERDKLPEWIRSEPSLDLARGIENAETAEVYLSSVGIFLAHVDENTALLERYCGGKDIENYTIKVHALKSTSRMIGAMVLAEKAAALERAGNSGNLSYIENENENLLREYHAIARMLKEHGSTAEKKELTEDAREDIRLSLLEYAEAEDYSLMETLLSQLSDYALSEAASGRLARIRKALNSLDWDEIRGILEEQ